MPHPLKINRVKSFTWVKIQTEHFRIKFILQYINIFIRPEAHPTKHLNPYNAEIFFYKPQRPKVFIPRP